ncbi:MAG: transmembrane anti-sigma factor [Bacteroidetes bacterium OLB11]|nr:MAG: transmembrane anti-sigma factor [Bacteroidetes bacterium OLB11]
MNNFSNIFSQSQCLSKKQLIEYIQQRLEKSEVYLVEMHLNECQMCNDALDALLEEDTTRLEVDLKSIKNELHQKLIPPILITEQKPVAANIPFKKNQETEQVGDFEISRKTFYRLLVAASLLLLFSFGAYSFYNHFISPTQTEISMNVDESLSQTTTSKYENQQIENRQIKTDEDNTLPLEEKKQDKEKLPSNINLKKAKNSDDRIKENIQHDNHANPSIEEPAEIAAAPAVQLPVPKQAERNIDQVQSKEQFKRQEDERVESLERKKAKETVIADSPNQPPIASLNKKAGANYAQPNETSDYELGLQYLNNQNYKQSIFYFEKFIKKQRKGMNGKISFTI